MKLALGLVFNQNFDDISQNIYSAEVSDIYAEIVWVSSRRLAQSPCFARAQTHISVSKQTQPACC